MTTYRYTAPSWDEFVHDLRTRKTNWGDLSQGSRVIGRADWSGCDTWEDALEYAVKGHPAGRAAIESAAVKVTMEPEPMWDTAPVGAFPCIPANAAGVPEDMFAMSDIAPPSPSPIVRIAVNMSANCNVDAQEIVNRGVAIVSLIDRIQLSGRRVELIAIKHRPDAYVLSQWTGGTHRHGSGRVVLCHAHHAAPVLLSGHGVHDPSRD